MTTREEWLQNLVDLLRPRFSAAGYPIPNQIRISCGWPSTRGLSKKNRRIGECWGHTAAKDGVPQIFVSPVLDEALEVASTVVHEAGHAALGTDKGHGKEFRAFMKAIGLAGKPTSTTAGPELTEALVGLLNAIGAYPNSRLDKAEGPVKKQSTRMLKIFCEGAAGGGFGHDPYVLRGSKNTVSMGLPKCPVCGADMSVAQLSDNDE